MKKKILLTLLSTLLMVSAMFGIAYASGKITIQVNGKVLSTDVESRLINDRVMVPISFISRALGATVSWDQETQTVSVNGYGITPRNFWSERPHMGAFTMAEINNSIQVFMAGIDSGLEELISKAVTSDMDVEYLAQMQNHPMGQSFLSSKVIDIRELNDSPSEYQVIVGVQTFDVDDVLEEFWDLTVVHGPGGGGGNMSYLVKKFEKIERNVVDEHRMFPGYIFKFE